MSATEELRRMLDERGVEWDELQSYECGKMTRWRDSMGRYVTAYDEGVTAFFDDFYWQPTAQQAIDATLGRGTCRDVGRYAFVCSECGWASDELHHVLGGFWPNFCPNCGREVASE